jgi:hypothetical protein
MPLVGPYHHIPPWFLQQNNLQFWLACKSETGIYSGGSRCDVCTQVFVVDISLFKWDDRLLDEMFGQMISNGAKLQTNSWQEHLLSKFLRIWITEWNFKFVHFYLDIVSALLRSGNNYVDLGPLVEHIKCKSLFLHLFIKIFSSV